MNSKDVIELEGEGLAMTTHVADIKAVVLYLYNDL